MVKLKKEKRLTPCLSQPVRRRGAAGFRAGRGVCAGVHESPDQGAQLEAPIDAVLGLGQVATRVLAELKVISGLFHTV